MAATGPKDKLYYGDNLDVLREHVADESVDLIYLDPPFNSNANYNVLFKAPTGERSQSQIEAFEDTWHWNDAAEDAYAQVLHGSNTDAASLLRAMREFLGENDMMAYLAMMAVRLLELHRVLKDTGSLYLHCDSTASHYLKVLMDAVFGPKMYRNEIIWRRTGSHNPRRSFGPVHDVIHFYTKTNDYKFNITRRPYMKGHVERRYSKDENGRFRFTSGGNVLTGAGATEGASGKVWRGFDPTSKGRHWAIPGFYEDKMPEGYVHLDADKKLEELYQAGLVEIKPGLAWPIMVRYLDERDGVPITDLWTYQPYTEETVHGTDAGIDADVAWLGPTDPERLGYPTQKPISLLERVVAASSDEGDVVLDPFCGCGTAVHAAQKMNRTWIGIDITHLAVSLIEKRLTDAFAYDEERPLDYEVIGTPKDEGAARDLFGRDPYQFEWWAVSLVDAQPQGGKKKGADKGIDGVLYVHPDAKTSDKVIVQVKGGKVSVPHIRDLKGTMEREKAAAAIYVSLEPPTKPMVTEAAAAGQYETPFGNFPRVQMLTVAELLEGKEPKLPPRSLSTFKRAPSERKPKETGALL